MPDFQNERGKDGQVGFELASKTHQNVKNKGVGLKILGDKKKLDAFPENVRMEDSTGAASVEDAINKELETLEEGTVMVWHHLHRKNVSVFI